MEMINTAASMLRATMDQNSFTMNMCLNNPTKENALDNFMESLSEYCNAKIQMETLEIVGKQVENFEEKDEAKVNTDNNASQS